MALSFIPNPFSPRRIFAYTSRPGTSTFGINYKFTSCTTSETNENSSHSSTFDSSIFRGFDVPPATAASCPFTQSVTTFPTLLDSSQSCSSNTSRSFVPQVPNTISPSFQRSRLSAVLRLYNFKKLRNSSLTRNSPFSQRFPTLHSLAGLKPQENPTLLHSLIFLRKNTTFFP
jgi:hypothetical protein